MFLEKYHEYTVIFCYTIAQRNFWKRDRLVASLLRRSHVEPLRGVFRVDDGFVSALSTLRSLLV